MWGIEFISDDMSEKRRHGRTIEQHLYWYTLSIRVLSLIIVMCTSSDLMAQPKEYEPSFSHIPALHFSPRNSNLKPTTWSVIQDRRGVIYVADEDGIKYFTGRAWLSIETSSGTTVRSLAASADGTLYYGAQGEFGKIEADSTGKLFAIDLSTYLYQFKISFGNVWATHVIGSTVVFQTTESIFIWDGHQIRTYNSESGFHTSHVVSGELYAREEGVGLMRLADGRFQLVNGGELLADTRIYMMYALDNDAILIGTQEKGLLRLDQDGFHSIRSELDRFQQYHSDDQFTLRLYAASRISDGLFAIATLGAGVVIIDKSGNIKATINKSVGLPDDWINHIFVADDRSLWIALNNDGVAYIDLFAPLVRLTGGSGVAGNINHIDRRDGVLHVSTGAGLYLQNRTPILITTSESTSSLTLEDRIGIYWTVFDLGSEFAVATGQGLRIIRPDSGGSTVINCSLDQTLSIFRSSYTNILIVGTKTGIGRVERSGDECSVEPITGVDEETWSIQEIGKNKFWLGTRMEGAILIETNDNASTTIQKKTYDETHGLPSPFITVEKVRGAPIFYSEYGPYRFVEAEDRFELFEELWPFEDGKTDSLFVMTEDHRGNVWMVFPDSIVKAIPNPDGTYAFHVPEALKFKKTSTSSILVEEDDVVWFNDGSELIRYDPKLDLPAEFTYNALINRVSVNGHLDAIHNGSFRGPSGGAVLDQPTWAIPTLGFDEKDLKFKISATTFSSPDDVRYQIWLQGRDEGWSPWTDEAEYYINGVNEGSYTFRVRARNAAGRISREASYSFVILPPWYRAWWAYIIYVMLGALFVYSGRKYYVMMRAHKLAAAQAEELAREREVNKVLQEANERLTKANRLKDEFLATTSHELRTPLTAILGFTSVLREEIPEDADYREFLDIIEDSGSRLMETLNSLLDLAKLRSGMMEINLETCDIYYQCCNGISGMQAAAERKKLEIFIERPKETIFVDLDVLGFLRILQNLVGNAIKFTESGHVKIVLDIDDDLVHMKICDTGIGIDEEFLPRLFDEFMQESDGPSRSYEGFGLGLAITARLVRLMHGSISVESKKGEGSQFIVTLPRAESIKGEPISVRGFGGVDATKS